MRALAEEVRIRNRRGKDKERKQVKNEKKEKVLSHFFSFKTNYAKMKIHEKRKKKRNGENG